MTRNISQEDLMNTQYVQDYLNSGWTPIPVAKGGKEPIYGQWQQTKPQDAAGLFRDHGDVNVGILLGAASGGLVDVDLDGEIAREIASSLLPSTVVVFGRMSRPRSHYAYQCDDAEGTIQF